LSIIVFSLIQLLNKRGRGTRFHDVKQQAVTADVEGMNN
jgi:hypothetical protein